MSEGLRRASVRAGDLDVHVVERGDGRPVVLLHGNWSTSSWWLPVIERAPAGVRAIACDLRGRGRTTGPDSSYAIASLADDLERLADALRLERVELVGHSLGSAVAMQIALARPARVAALCLVAPSWVDGMPAHLHSEAQQRALAADRGLLGRALTALAPGVVDGPFWQRLIDEGHAQRIEAAVRNLDALTEWAPGDALSAIEAPCLVVSGTLDRLVGGDVPRRVASLLGAEHVVLEGVGHCVPVEAPERLAPLVFGPALRRE